jgi:antitoxin (DNA-binding transcriptional repressor) of toxin-antitoxin stability system
MSSKEVGIEQARKTLGDLADAAHHRGEVTYLTKYGRPYAAIVPVSLVPQESVMSVTLYETNSDLLVIARGKDAWSLHLAGDHMEGMFAQDAAAWINGEWEPSEGDGQSPTSTDDLTAVATWDEERDVTLLVLADSLGAAAREYLPTLNVVGATFTRDNDNPEWGTDTITITVTGSEVVESFTVDGISDKDTRSFSSPHEVESYLHDRRIDLIGDGYRED